MIDKDVTADDVVEISKIVVRFKGGLEQNLETIKSIVRGLKSLELAADDIKDINHAILAKALGEALG